MSDESIRSALDSIESRIAGYEHVVDKNVTACKHAVRNDCIRIREDISLRVSVTETRLIRCAAIITYNADYHLLRAYFHASLSLILILKGIYNFVKAVLEVIGILNTFMQIITGETLIYWLDQLIPGFQTVWDDIMNKVSEFSAILGWGVDGVHHLLNARNAGADLWGMVTGKELGPVKIAKFERTDALLTDYSTHLKLWQSDPGAQIAKWAEGGSESSYYDGWNFVHNITNSIGAFGEKAERALTNIGSITDEVLSIRNDMPAIVARYIPAAIWDSIGRVDTAINERILPALTNITDRISEVDAVLDSHRKKAAEMADKIMHPGDMLTDINNLPDWLRAEQVWTIDVITSSLLQQQNITDIGAITGDLKEFARVVEALSHAPAPLEFMELELPGRSPGIVAEPRETWFVGDF